ncbi:hypothetical protein BS50DRAFT_575425 [Corynespora cassiicola Philippines]|uniref:Prion-inhibition and propagation HeLo domain-containing protein n=1 Tax=Corynespora cassiicola Philippines TaxID=1448308 RepID=A0A2T2NIY7_CORCC|nr:hypothetical protein BS50DRAFT_575425 [Corynespora cassiicola Philippines]
MAATTNGTGLDTPPTTPPPALSKAQILTNVLSLATQFSTCVEAFNLVHPSKDSDKDQRIALAKLGLQQGRLLIFGDAVGISSPPATIARHMIPSHPGATNPDPHLPVNFGTRDPKLDDPSINEKVRAALTEIEGRPSHLSREELMEKYGLKSPKRFTMLEYPSLDTNRLEAFREKYALLQDLVKQTGARAGLRRGLSMTMTHWQVRDVQKFEDFVRTVRVEVDGLVALLGVKEQVDRGMKSDIKSMGWHPDLSGPIVRQDWEKLRLIREACADDYPEYVEVTEAALKYISEELRGTSLANMRAAYPAPPIRRKSEENGHEKEKQANGTKTPDKEKRPGWLSHFKFKSKSKGQKSDKERSQSLAVPEQDAQRSLSEDLSNPPRDSDDGYGLEPTRSKSLSALPDETAPFNLDSRLVSVPTNEDKPEEKTANVLVQTPTASSVGTNQLEQATTVQSLIDRHDMYKGVGRVETKDIRNKAHEWQGS